MEIVHIEKQTYCIETRRELIPFYKINDKDIVMMDSGWLQNDKRELEKLLDDNKLNVVAIICTHAHVDHIGAVKQLKEKYNCKVIMSKGEGFFCKDINRLKLFFSGLSTKEAIDYYGHMIMDVDKLIKENETSVIIEDKEFKIINISGHSIGHIGVITPDDVAYVGDTLMSYEVVNAAKFPYAYNIKQDILSKIKLKELKYERYVVAHKGIYNDISELIDFNIEIFNDRSEKIYELLDSEMSFEEVLRVILEKYKININNIAKYKDMESIVVSHLEYLIEKKKIKITIGTGILKYTRIN